LSEGVSKQMIAIELLEKKDFDSDIIKEALKEWLDAQFAAFGKWTFMGLLSLLFVAVSYAWLWEHGWHK
jgi:hypothetical protein